jgi:hypothetical protein
MHPAPECGNYIYKTMAKLHLLSDPECKSATTNGKEIRKRHDGGGLYLWVYADGRKYWRLRYKITGSEKSLDIGVTARKCRAQLETASIFQVFSPGRRLAFRVRWLQGNSLDIRHCNGSVTHGIAENYLRQRGGAERLLESLYCRCVWCSHPHGIWEALHKAPEHKVFSHFSFYLLRLV